MTLSTTLRRALVAAASAALFAGTALAQQASYRELIFQHPDGSRSYLRAPASDTLVRFALPASGGTLLTSSGGPLQAVTYGEATPQDPTPYTGYLFNLAHDTTVGSGQDAVGAMIRSQSLGGSQATGLTVQSVGSGIGTSTALTASATGAVIPDDNIAVDVIAGDVVLRRDTIPSVVTTTSTGVLQSRPGALPGMMLGRSSYGADSGQIVWKAGPDGVLKRYNGVRSPTYGNLSIPVEAGKRYTFTMLIGMRGQGFSYFFFWNFPNSNPRNVFSAYNATSITGTASNPTARHTQLDVNNGQFSTVSIADGGAGNTRYILFKGHIFGQTTGEVRFSEFSGTLDLSPDSYIYYAEVGE